ncbi:hypothetical protein ACFYVR_20500 [Rhodococcus sp. NPDC003318]|uniref:hypothetical protein n=1 Tax=Rhodococcus sp. NPDC003318 TaxID=3364503 RepID=UPI0036BC50AB
MITWLVALLCSTAVGARIGRLTVRPPSLARVSIAIAAVALTAAATVRTTTVVDVLDGFRDDLAATSFEWCLIAFAATTSLIAAASLTRLSTRSQWPVAVTAAALALVVAAVEVTADHGALTNGYLVVTTVFAVAVGVRHVAWNPLGRAIGLYCLGLAVIAGVCAVTLVANPGNHLDPASSWWSVAVILVSGGCSSVMIEAWVRAKVDLRRTRRLWTALTAAHPELLDSDYRSVTATLTAGDRVSQILDGLYLHAGGGLIGPGSTAPPEDLSQRATVVAAWLHRSAFEVEPIDPRWLGTPVEVTDREWILALSAAYDRPRRRAGSTVT